jgi:hypothetical protein
VTRNLPWLAIIAVSLMITSLLVYLAIDKISDGWCWACG